MANREIYPSALFPNRGDLSAEAGATTTTVIGLQTTPISATLPTGAQALIAVDTGAGIVWTPEPNDSSITVNGVPLSDDYDISVNLPLGISDSPVFVNGT